MGAHKTFTIRTYYTVAITASVAVVEFTYIVMIPFPT